MKKSKLLIIGILSVLYITTPMVYGNRMEIPTVSQNTQSWESVGPCYFYDDYGRILKSYHIYATNISGSLYVKFDAEWEKGMHLARKTVPADKGYRKFTHVFETEGTKYYFNYYN